MSDLSGRVNYFFIKDESIIISTKKYKDQDRIVTLLTKNHGKINALAKGVRKLTSKKRSSLKMFNKVLINISTNYSLPIITEVEVIDDYPKIGIQIKKITVAFYFIELINKLVPFNDNVLHVYLLLNKYLSLLEDESKDLKSLRINFSAELLESLGYIKKSENKKDLDVLIQTIIQSKINSIRIGKKMLQ